MTYRSNTKLRHYPRFASLDFEKGAADTCSKGHDDRSSRPSGAIERQRFPHRACCGKRQ